MKVNLLYQGLLQAFGWMQAAVLAVALFGQCSAVAVELESAMGGDGPLNALRKDLESSVLKDMGIDPDEIKEGTWASAFPLGMHELYGDLWAVCVVRNHQDRLLQVFARLENDAWSSPLGEMEGFLSWVIDFNRNIPVCSRAGLPVKTRPNHEEVYFVISGQAGKHADMVEIYEFDGKGLLRITVVHQGIGAIEEQVATIIDLENDGVDEILLTQSYPYVFFRGDEVKRIRKSLLYWNHDSFLNYGRFLKVSPSMRIEEIPDALHSDAERVQELVGADLWLDAASLSRDVAARAPDNQQLRRQSFVIGEVAAARLAHAGQSGQPLLTTVFAGEYAQAFELMRVHPPAELFSWGSPLVVGTAAQASHWALAPLLLDHTERALAVRPKDPHIYAVRSLALAFSSPEDLAAARQAVDAALELAPTVDYLRQVQRHLRSTDRLWSQSAASEAAKVELGLPAVGERFRDCWECPLMVVVPGGFGSQHESVAQPFAVGVYEVQHGEYRWFVEDATQSATDAINVDGEADLQRPPGCDWRSPGFQQGESHPVVCVNWEDAQAYAKWLSRKTGHHYRLLSQLEWEYAARAGIGRSGGGYWKPDRDTASGPDKNQCFYANGWDDSMGFQRTGCNDGYSRTAPAGSFKANDFGLFDVLGNAWEWTQDCWAGEDGPVETVDGVAWEGGDCLHRVLRGGSWYGQQDNIRFGERGKYPAWIRSNLVGFRVARSLRGETGLASPVRSNASD